MSEAPGNVWLNRYAWFTAAAVLGLLCLGGLVTSHGAGLAVPDWPNTYGYNMFLFPVSKWVGGIFYEHTHRLVAAGVGLLTLGLALWLWLAESRRWVRRLGWLALGTVVLQGVLGGLRVVLLQDQLGTVHAAVGQLFLVLTTSIALVTTRWWPAPHPATRPSAQLTRWLLAITGLVFVQLLLGAAMRHQHAGLAVPDFPLAYGRLWPRTGAAAIAGYNQARLEISAAAPITAGGVVLHMTHRSVALLIVGGVGVAATRARREAGAGNPLTRLSRLWVALALAQVGLGAVTVWTNKSADVTTAHVAVGSLCLVVGALLVLVAARLASVRPEQVAEPLVLPRRCSLLPNA
jgi:cytochrome c oxidase assembly protein subunit 15